MIPGHSPAHYIYMTMFILPSRSEVIQARLAVARELVMRVLRILLLCIPRCYRVLSKQIASTLCTVFQVNGTYEYL